MMSSTCRWCTPACQPARLPAAASRWCWSMTWICCKVGREIEEQAVRLRQESIAEGTLPADFPMPYLTWSELQDSLSGHTWLNWAARPPRANLRNWRNTSRPARATAGA
jgi:hypothetical protein